MPAAPRVAIIGGGIIGCAAAAFLAERGVSVSLFEQTAIGAGASGRNLGAIQHPFDPLLAPLYRDSLDRYRVLAQASDEFSVPVEPAGLLLLNPDADAVRRQVAHFSESVPELQPTFLDEVALADAEPVLAPGFSACRLATGYPVPPDSVTAGYAALAVQLGAVVRNGIAAEPWVEGGRLRGIILADGSSVRADAVLIAAGPWSPPLVDAGGGWAPMHRTWGVTVQLRLDGVLQHVMEEDEVDSVNRPVVATARAAAADATAAGADTLPSLFSLASANGISTLGSTFLPSEPEPRAIARLLLARAQRFVPAIGSAEILQTRMCARPQSLDGRPFIGPVGGIDGLFVCAGHGPWGISTGPGSAALVVDVILGTGAIAPELRAGRHVQSAQMSADTGRATTAG